MFNLFKKKEEDIFLGAHVKGEAISLSKVEDAAFAGGLLGPGAAIIPDGDVLDVVAPCDGEINMVFDTRHAVTLTSPEGVEILIHIGINTINLNGECFTAHVQSGEKVKKGDNLITVDFKRIKEKGYDPVVPMVICNNAEYKSVEEIKTGSISVGDDLIKIER